MPLRALLLLLCLAAPLTAADPPRLALSQGDHVSLVGNTLAERMQHDGWLETFLHTRFPDLNLSVRNLGYSGDELTKRLRSDGFGSPDEWLARAKTDVVFAFFGSNESYGGKEGLPKFRADLAEFIKNSRAKKYNGKSEARVVVFSPIAHENLGRGGLQRPNKNVPDGKENNVRLELYAAAMREVAEANGAVFIDLFHPTKTAFENQNTTAFTINGIHLTERGNRLLAEIIDAKLFDHLGRPSRDNKTLEADVRRAVNDKDFHWYQRYRTTDGYSIFGGRADLKFVGGQTNRVVAEREMLILDQMTAGRDEAIWAVARGQKPAIDDSKTEPFIDVKTNKPGAGPSGQHVYQSAEDGIKKMTIGKGLKVNVFASEEMFPGLLNEPVQMTWDAKGRLWVSTMPSYPHWKPKAKLADKILIFEDTDGDGKANTCKVFADNLHVPTGIEFYDGGVFVGAQPDLMYLKDTDGDDKADVRERVLHGVDSADTHHALNSFTTGPGGDLYFQEGTFHKTQVETPYGPPVRNADAAVYRYDPRTMKFEVYTSYGFANPHGHVFDRWGQDFITDGTGNQNYFAAAFTGRTDYPNKHRSYKTFFQQRTRPAAGTEILSSQHFPPEFQSDYLIANVIGFQGIQRYKFSEDGAGFGAKEMEPIVFSSDPNFRPTDLEVGPDGALYFLDWHNTIIGHMQHNLRDPSRDTTHGRIYRVTHENRPLSKAPKIDGATVRELLQVLKHPEDRVRYRARIELGRRPADEVLSAVKEFLIALGLAEVDDPEIEHHKLEALWVMKGHNKVSPEHLQAMLKSPDPRARAAAVRVLCYSPDAVKEPLALLKVAANDVHSRVRLEAVRACSFFRESSAAEVALEALKREADYWIDYTLKETMTTLEPYWKPAVAQGKPFAADNPAGVNFILKGVPTPDLFKMTPSAPVFVAIASREGVTPEQRVAAIGKLAEANKGSFMAELFRAIDRVDLASHEAHSGHLMHDLAQILVTRPVDELKTSRDRLDELARCGMTPTARQAGRVALVMADGSLEPSWKQAQTSAKFLRDFVESVELLPDAKLKAAAYDKVSPLLKGVPENLLAELKKSEVGKVRVVRIEIPGGGRTLSLAEVQVFAGARNVAGQGKVRQSSTDHNGVAERAIDGRTDGDFGSGTITHTREELRPWWELDLGSDVPVESIVVWNRTDPSLGKRLDGFSIILKDAMGREVFRRERLPAPAVSTKFVIGDDLQGSIRRSAMQASAAIPGHEAETASALAGFIQKNDERDTAVRALRRIPKSFWPRDMVKPTLAAVVDVVAKLPPSERTEAAGIDLFALGNDLISLLPSSDAKDARAKLGDLGVQVLMVRTVPHRMIYDRSKLYVEAGKPAVLVFENPDLMPHNFVLSQPNTLAEIGIGAEAMAADPTGPQKGYVPPSNKIIFASRMLAPQESQRLTFTAPKSPGDYTYLCTFPGHWRVMFGTLKVVPKLADVPPEELNAPPEREPASGVAARPFVRQWTFDDLKGDLPLAEKGRDFAKGKALFAVANCISCHKVGDEGQGVLGPNLAELPQKILDKKMTRDEVLRSILHPSEKIEDKYRTVNVQLLSGGVASGMVLSEDKAKLVIQAGPNEKPREIPANDIDDKAFSKVSLMPEGLLVTLSKDEILDLLAYVSAGGNAKAPAFKK